MCGIAGILTAPGDQPSEVDLKAMAVAMSHRGPDSDGVFRQGPVGLAHTRLSIIDTSSAGFQPVVDDEVALSFNGEIYNYRHLRGELESSGIPVRGASDTSVLFACLKAWGVERTLPRLEGMFAFSFADLRSSTVWLCRDRFGIKPLWLTRHGDAVVWASEAKAIRAAVPVHLDPFRTIAALAGSIESLPTQTCFQGVSQVDAGEFLVCRPGMEPSRHRWFGLDELVDEARYRSLDAASAAAVAEEFATLLDDSVEKMLMSDVPMGAFVSGGVDSSLLAAVAARRGAELTLYTANVVGAHSELEKAEQVAAHVRLPLREARFAPEDFTGGWIAQTLAYEAPIVTFTNAVPFARVAQVATLDGIKPVLTGEGADELFLGYPDMVRDRYLRVARGPATALDWFYRRISPSLADRVFPSARGTSGQGALLMSLAVDFDLQRAMLSGPALYPFLEEGQASSMARSAQMARSHLRGLLHRNDRMGMQASIESRFPFLDEPLVAFALNLPVKHKIRWVPRVHDAKHPFMADKFPVRQHAGSLLPHDIAWAPKDGFPMYGHKNVRLSQDFFVAGWVQETLGLSASTVASLTTAVDSYTLAKLASVEIFGRIFGFGIPVDELTATLSPLVTLVGT